MQASLRGLFESACAARENAYAPYSGCRVGAALRTERGATYVGCNVENASYGATLCAERVAIGAAVAAESTPRLIEIMIVVEAETVWPPCGLCRQVIAEFGADCIVHSANLSGAIESRKFEQLFPQAFSPHHLIAS